MATMLGDMINGTLYCRDSPVGITTRYWLDGPNPHGDEIFRTRQTRPGVHPTSYTLGNGSLSKG